MAINYIDYDVLEQGKNVYSQKAQELQSLLGELVRMNGQLSQGWQNDTARAFVDRFDRDHKRAIEKVVDALNEISTYICQYAANRSDEDSQGAGALSK